MLKTDNSLSCKSTTVLLTLLALLLLPRPAAAHGVVKLTGGRWFNGASFEEKTLYSAEGVFREQWTGEVNGTIDLGGKFVLPPLADAHNHGFAETQLFERELRRALRLGLFTIANPNNLASTTAGVRPRVNLAESVDVIYSNGGITASGGHPVQLFEIIAKHGGVPAGDAYFVVDTKADLDAQWPRILAGKPDFIKTYLEHSEEYAKRREEPRYYGQRGLDPAVLREIVKRAHAANLRVATHIATAADFRAAVDAGVDQIAHLPLERITADDAAAAAKKKIVVVTTTLSHRPTAGIDDVDGIHRANVALLRKAGVTIALGTDNHQKDVIDEAENLLRLGAFTRAELLRALTETTAQAIFPNRRFGRLTDGYEASFVAYTENPLQDLAVLRRAVLRVKKGHVLEIPPEKPPVAELLQPIAIEKGAAAALAEYERLLREKPDVYQFGEAQLNRLGYLLLNAHKLGEAIVVFQKNVALFPQSANVYDSLGEAYALAGDKERAVANYKRAVELNPHNTNAVEALKKLGANVEVPH